MMTHHNHDNRRAFTILELLVVIIIIAALATLAIPRFGAILDSNDASLAQQQLQAALRGGRDAAIRSGGDADTAVVFFYQPGGRTSLVICRRTALFIDRSTPGNPQAREVFVPIGDALPVQLPRNWMIRGFTPLNTIGQTAAADWYEPARSVRYKPDQPNWVFPETGFYDPLEPDEGQYRQTFMVRFEAGTGEMITSPNRTALVFDPRPSQENRDTSLPEVFRADLTDNPARLVRTILSAPSNVLSDRDKRDLIGIESSDMIAVRCVGKLALYDVRKLAAGLRRNHPDARVDRETGCLYVPPVDGPDLVVNPNGSDFDIDINSWISGNTNFDGQLDVTGSRDDDFPEARVFTIQRHTAFLQEVEVVQ